MSLQIRYSTRGDLKEPKALEEVDGLGAEPPRALQDTAWDKRVAGWVNTTFRDVTDPAFLGPMIAAQGIFGISRLGFLNLFKSSAPKGMALVQANLGAFALEGVGFVGAERGIGHFMGRHELNSQDWAPSLGHAYLTLGLLKGLGGLTHTALKKVYTDVPIGHFTWQDRLMVRSTPQAASFLGIFLSHSLAPSLGLGEPMALSDRLSQSATTLVHFGLAGQILNRLPRYAEINAKIGARTDRFIQKTWEGSSYKFLSFFSDGPSLQHTAIPLPHPFGIKSLSSNPLQEIFQNVGLVYTKPKSGRDSEPPPRSSGRLIPISSFPPLSQNKVTVVDMTVPGLSFRINADGKFLDVQGDQPMSFLIKKEYFIGTRIQDLPLPDSIRERLLTALGKALQSRNIQSVEFVFPSPEGVHHREVIFAPLAKDEVMAIARDTTDLKIREAEREAMLSILNASSEMVCMVTREGKIFYMNQKVLDRVGPMTREKLVEREDFSLNHPDWAAELIRNVAIPTTAREGVWMGETAILDNMGKEIPVLHRIIAHRDSEGNLTHFSTILTEITDMKRVQEFRLSEERLKALKFMVPGLIHDINNHLGSIISRNQVLRSELGRLQEVVESVKNAVQNPDFSNWDTLFAELRKRLRKSTPPAELGTLKVQDKPSQEHAKELLADLGGVLNYLLDEIKTSQTAIDQIKYLLASLRELDGEPKRGPAFNINNLLDRDLLAEVLPPQQEIRITSSAADSFFVPGPQGEILRAIHNIVKNAGEAMEGLEIPTTTIQSHGQVLSEVALSKIFPLWKDWEVRPGKFVKITIADHGRGMDEQTRSRIFEPFFSTKKRGSDESRRDESKPSGVGLAITRKIVKDAGGFILVESTPGKGTRFEVYLPRVAPEDSLFDPARYHRTLQDPILFLEDGSGSENGIPDYLKQQGFKKVLSAHDAVSIRDQLKIHPEARALFINTSNTEFAESDFAALQLEYPNLAVIRWGVGLGQDPGAITFYKSSGKITLTPPITPGKLAFVVASLLEQKSNPRP